MVLSSPFSNFLRHFFQELQSRLDGVAVSISNCCCPELPPLSVVSQRIGRMFNAKFLQPQEADKVFLKHHRRGGRSVREQSSKMLLIVNHRFYVWPVAGSAMRLCRLLVPLSVLAQRRLPAPVTRQQSHPVSPAQEAFSSKHFLVSRPSCAFASYASYVLCIFFYTLSFF